MSTAVPALPDVFKCFDDEREGVQRCFGELMRASIVTIQEKYKETLESLAKLWGVKVRLLRQIVKREYSAIDGEALDRLLGPLEVPFNACERGLKLRRDHELMASWVKITKDQQFYILAATGNADEQLKVTDEDRATLFVLLEAVRKL